MHEANLGLHPLNALSGYECAPKASKPEMVPDIQALAALPSTGSPDAPIGLCNQRKISDDYDFDNHLSDQVHMLLNQNNFRKQADKKLEMHKHKNPGSGAEGKFESDRKPN